MSVETQSPPVDVSPPARGKRRWLRILMLGIFVAALVVAVGGSIYIHHYQPFTIGAEATSSIRADPKNTDLDGDFQSYVYRDGRLLHLAVWIENNGHWGVTVTGIDKSPQGWQGLVSLVGTRFGQERYPTDLTRTAPFHPFSLGSGQSRLIEILFRMGHCASSDPGTSESLDTVGVRFTVLGVHRSQPLTLMPGIWVDSPPAGECPGRSP